MSWDEMLTQMKIDLGIVSTAYDTRFNTLLSSAYSAITMEGIVLDTSLPEHADLVVSYAAWLWRKRDTGEGLPRWLRWRINNLLFSQKTGGGADSE